MCGVDGVWVVSQYALAQADVVEALRGYRDDSFDALVSDPPYFLEFQNKEWDTAGQSVPVEEQVFRAWFAGFVAGEGYFRIHKTHGGDGYACHFGIHMRQDEAPVLRALQRRTGAGQIMIGDERDNGRVQSAPDVRWIIQSRTDCEKIARILDGQPLYAKKQREYDLWRRALEQWKAHKRGNDWSPLASLYEEMKTLRPFDADLASSDFNPFGSSDYQFHYRWAEEAFRVLKPGAHIAAFGGARTFHRLACAIEDAGFELRDTLMWLYAKGKPASTDKTKIPEELEGHNTCLKPSYEPIILARKPMIGSLAENFAAFGTGALDIDACRQGGRWPSNVWMDEDVAAQFDAEQGEHPSRAFKENDAEGAVLPFTKRTAGGYDDSGGPSRYFFSTKVDRKEREAGCDDIQLKTAAELTGRKPGSAGLSNSRAGAGRTGGYRNSHPTLKKIKCTECLGKLVKPPTPGVLLVPFAGAGSEMIGALKAGWPCVFGIEREAEYVEIARARLRHWIPEGREAA